MINLSLILPVYNQADILEPVFADIYKTLQKTVPSFEIILVENGSKDESWDAVKKIAKQYKHTYAIQSKKGYGTAINTGMKKAKGEFVSYMPSDGQVDMKVFPKLWKTAQTKTYDVVKVKRPSRENVGRLFISKFWSYLMLLLYQRRITDVNGNPRIVLRKKISELKLTSPDSFIDGEFFIKAIYLGWSFFEIPMKHIDRAGGESTRKFSTYTEFIYNIFDAKFGDRFSKWKQQYKNEQNQSLLQIIISRFFLPGFFILFPLILLSPFLLDPHIQRVNDLNTVTFSIQYVKNMILNQHFIPQWNFYANEGIPIWADPLNTLLNPLVAVLFLLFPLTVFIKSLYSILLILACFSMYYVCRKLGANSFFSALSSLTYISSGYVISRILLAHFLILSYPVLPLFFLSIIMLYRKSSLLWSTILALCLTYILFSEDLNSLLYGSIIIGSVSLFALLQKKNILGYIGSGILFLFFAAARLIPLIQVSPFIGKIQEPFAGSQNLISIFYYVFLPVKPLFRFFHLSQFITPDFAWWEKIAYIGILPLICIAFLFFKKIDISQRFLYLFIFLILILISMPAFSLNPYHYAILSIQILQNFHVPSRVFNYIDAFLLIITGIGASYIMKKNYSHTVKSIIVVFFLLNLITTIIFFMGIEIKKPMPIIDSNYIHILNNLRRKDNSLFYTMPVISGDEVPFNTLHTTHENMVCDYAFMLSNSACYQYILLNYKRIPAFTDIKPKYLISDKNPAKFQNYKLSTVVNESTVHADLVTNYTPFASIANGNTKKEILLTPKNISKDTLRFSKNAETSGETITIMQNYYPGWHAFIDGKPVPFLSKKFLMVKTQKGNHIYTFSFYSPLYGIAFAISCISLIGWGVFLLMRLQLRTILQELSY